MAATVVVITEKSNIDAPNQHISLIGHIIIIVLIIFLLFVGLHLGRHFAKYIRRKFSRRQEPNLLDDIEEQDVDVEREISRPISSASEDTTAEKGVATTARRMLRALPRAISKAALVVSKSTRRRAPKNSENQVNISTIFKPRPSSSCDRDVFDMTRFSSFNLYEDPQPSTSATTDFEVLGATCSNYYDENWESFFSQDGPSVRETASKNETFNLDSDLPRFMNPPSRSARNKQVQGVNERDFTTCDNYYGKNWESFSSQDCSSAWKAASEKETFNPISDLPNLTNPSSSDAGNKGVQGLSERDSLRLQPWGDKLNTFETKLSASQGSASKDHYDDYYKHQSKKDTYNNLEIWPSNSSVKEEMAEGATFSQKKVKFIQDHAEYFNNSNILQAADENKIIQSMVDERFNTHTEYDGNYHKSNADKKEASGNNFTTKDGKKIVRILKPVSGKPCRPIHEVLKQTEGPEQYLFRDKENTADDLNNSSEENGDQSPGIVSIELFDWNTADDSNLIKKRNNEPGTSKQATVIRRSYGQRDRNERKKPFEQLKKFFQWKKAKKFEDTSTGKNWKFLRALRETPYEGHNKSIPLPVFSPESNGSCSQGAKCSFRRSKAITFIKKLTKSPKNETDEESLSQDVKNEFNAEALVLEEMKEFPEKETADELFSLAVKNESKNEALIFEPEAWSSFENLYDEEILSDDEYGNESDNLEEDNDSIIACYDSSEFEFSDEDKENPDSNDSERNGESRRI